MIVGWPPRGHFLRLGPPHQEPIEGNQTSHAAATLTPWKTIAAGYAWRPRDRSRRLGARLAPLERPAPIGNEVSHRITLRLSDRCLGRGRQLPPSQATAPGAGMARLSQLQGVLLRTNQGGLFADSPGGHV